MTHAVTCLISAPLLGSRPQDWPNNYRRPNTDIIYGMPLTVQVFTGMNGGPPSSENAFLYCQDVPDSIPIDELRRRMLSKTSLAEHQWLVANDYRKPLVMRVTVLNTPRKRRLIDNREEDMPWDTFRYGFSRLYGDEPVDLGA